MSVDNIIQAMYKNLMVSPANLCYDRFMYFKHAISMRLFYYVLMLVLSLPVFARSDDAQQAIHFSAGQVEWDQQTSRAVFSNKLVFIQGTTEITAESGYAIGDKEHQFKKIVLLGTPQQQARFKTIPQANESILLAYADKMIYLPGMAMIKLIGHVNIEQARYHFHAPYLEYHLKNKKIISKSKDQDLTTVTIEPEPYEKHPASPTFKKII